MNLATHDFTQEIIMEDRAPLREDRQELAAVNVNEVRQPALTSEGAAILSLIERAAMNPAVDIDKMERLFEMQKQAQARTAQAAFDDALALMQPELPVIEERGKISTDKGKTVQSTYALWEDINEQIKPILARHGFALTFRVKNAPGVVSITGILGGHGHREETTLDLPIDGSGSKNGVQAVGSSTSYGQRYTAKLLLNLTSRGADDDGKGSGPAGGGNYVTDDQASEIQALMEDVGADRSGFLSYMKAPSIAEIPAKDFARALSALEKKRAR